MGAPGLSGAPSKAINRNEGAQRLGAQPGRAASRNRPAGRSSTAVRSVPGPSAKPSAVPVLSTASASSLDLDVGPRVLELKDGVPSRVIDGAGALQAASSVGGGATRGGGGPAQSIVASVRTIFLPAGFPDSVTPDYLPYQLWTLPTHVTGAIASSLTTSIMLGAVGVSAGAAGTAMTAAAVKWILKDGVGAVGRALVGSRLGLEFDDDPKRWRLLAELISTAGLGLEVATVSYPQHFLLLASVGNFARAVAKGIGGPAFTVIQTHFASVRQNYGAVGAKEEVWEVVAQLAGYATSVLVLETVETMGLEQQSVAAVWAVVQAAHIVLRYRAISTLVFDNLNQKRACILVSQHVAVGAVPGVEEVNRAEPKWLPASSMQPCVELGVSLATAFGGADPPPQQLAAYLKLYEGEQYVLVWDDDGGSSGSSGSVARQQRLCRARVLLKVGATGTDYVRALWQAAWLLRHTEAAAGNYSGSGGGGGASPEGNGSSSGSADLRRQEHAAAAGPQSHDPPLLLHRSLEATRQSFGHFLATAAAQGWVTDRVSFCTGTYRLNVD